MFDEESKDFQDNICRDYLRNVCKRGARCKYHHPDEPKENNNTSPQKGDIVFCHDYQNNGCNRPSCKYTHCTREEEEFYNVSGQLPLRIQRNVSMGLGAGNDDMAVAQGDIPVCKDFLKGNCSRGNKCKYRHVNQKPEEVMLRPVPTFASDMMERTRLRPSINGRACDIFDYDDDLFDYDHSRMKRRRMDVDENWRYQLLDEENIMLRHKIQALKQQVSDLKATNEVLLEQNARYRIQKVNILSAPVRMNQSVTTLSSAAPAVAAASVNRLALTNDLAVATQHAALQHMPASGAPVGLNPVSIVPVSLPQNSMAAAVSMAQTISGLVPYSLHTASSMAL